MPEKNMTTKIVCPDCNRVHKKTEPCICKKTEYSDPKPFDR